MSDQNHLYVEPDDEGMYQWEDEDGLQLYGSEDELDAWAQENGYVDVPAERQTPDTMTEYGVTRREVWNTLSPGDRASAREAWAVDRYKQLKEDSR